MSSRLEACRTLLVLWGKHATRNEQLTQLDAVRRIDIEDIGSGATGWRQANKQRALPSKRIRA
jgi:hypothetical protein